MIEGTLFDGIASFIIGAITRIMMIFFSSILNGKISFLFSLISGAFISVSSDLFGMLPLGIKPSLVLGGSIMQVVPGLAFVNGVRDVISGDLVSGGAVNLSDRMDRLNAKGVELARRLVSAVHGEQGLPLDLYQSAQPAVWLQKLPDGRHRVLLINWSDEPKAMSFDFAAHGIQCTTATDFWHDGRLPVVNGTLSATVPPRSCLLAETDE